MRRRAAFVSLVLAIALGSYFVLMHFARYALLPYTWVFEQLLPLSFDYIPDIGHYSAQYHFAITPSCMGARFFVAAYLIMCLTGPRDGLRAAVRCHLASLCLTFGITVSRIAISLPFVRHPSGQLIHNALSQLIYFGGLLSLYLIIQRRRYRVRTKQANRS